MPLAARYGHIASKKLTQLVVRLKIETYRFAIHFGETLAA
jgi:hypothetical protein